MKADKDSYQRNLEAEFATIFLDCGDLVHCKPLMSDILNRQEILFMQYEMEKRGKNLGMAENRLFRIEQGKLLQIDSDGEEKELPNPSGIVMVKRGRERWEPRYQQYKAMLLLKFEERSDITVFFKQIIEWREISMYVLASIQKRKGRELDQLAKRYSIAVAEQFAKKIKQMRSESADLQQLRVKGKLNDVLRYKLSDKSVLDTFMDRWKSKALFWHRPISLKLGLRSFKSTAPVIGIIKMWTQGFIKKQTSISSQHASQSLDRGCYSYQFHGQMSEDYIGMNSDDQIQFQIQCERLLFKSQRFAGLDLVKVAHYTRLIEINLASKTQTALLVLDLEIEGISPTQEPISISPTHFRMIDELYVREDKQFQLKQIHRFYSNELRSARRASPYYLSCNRLKQLFQLLKIDELINKFYLVSPFKDFVQAQCKGSVVYDYFVEDHQHHLYYDVEKILWKHQKFSFRQMLSALKSFDQNPKFNFTESFLFIAERMYQIAETETISRWKSSIFSKDTQGLEAVAFFLTLAVVKTFPSLFIYQQFPNKRALPYNSLLFMCVLQKHSPIIHTKILKIELNIEAFFGSHLVSLFANLFKGDTFTRVLLKILSEKQQEQQGLYYCSLIGVFLAAMELTDRYKCAYVSAQHYLIAFEEICRNIDNKLAFFNSANDWQQKVTKEANTSQFSEMIEDMTEFYLNNAYSGDLGEIASQIYQEFLCYHYKNQMDLRKIFIVIDKIQLGEKTPELSLTIFQSAIKVYEHKFKGVDLTSLDHFIELKLTRLDELNMICSTGKYSFSCRVDPKEMPSNLYFHLVKPLILIDRMTPEINRHLFMQVYIKDNCQIQSLQNPIPNKYRQLLLEDEVNKEDLLFCKKFSKSFRMPENNFNLLYTKLSWYGNHYLIPDDRLLSIQILGPKQAGQEELHINMARLSRYTRAIYGKAILPLPIREQRKISVDLIKENILTSFDPRGVSSQFGDMNVYSSASRLLCYCLDNFNIPCSMNFLEFYQQMRQKLPLVDYLSYQPKQFYYLPSFTFQVFNSNSTSTVLISEKGYNFITHFTPEQIALIQEKAASTAKLPLQLEFSYTDRQMYMHQFLFLLRLNILKRVGELEEGRGVKSKMKRWPNSLISSAIFIPNYPLRYFYEVMNQTKQIVQFEFKETNRLQNSFEYREWGLIKNRWREVTCLAQLKNTDGLNYYYVMERLENKKYILSQSHLIQVSEGSFKQIVLRDDISNSMEVVGYELSKVFSS